MDALLPPIPYCAIERHGVIGDRRSAALVAADGTIDWFCFPHFSGSIIFGALLDYDSGGHWRLGPAAPQLGTQEYRADTATLVTTWECDRARLELTDAMAWPDHSANETPARRAIVRRVRCTGGPFECALDFQPRHDFGAIQRQSASEHRATWRVGEHSVRLWSNRPLEVHATAAQAVVRLQPGEEFWAVLELGDAHDDWSVARAVAALSQTEHYWQTWAARLERTDVGRHVRRAALTAILLTYAPEGAVVAAATTSLPERIGGDWNADYRFAWVRDASLTMGMLAQLGDTESGGRYLEWLTQLDSIVDAPLQVLYGVRGKTDLTPQERRDLYGYRGSVPVRFGNHAFQQHQHDALGYAVDCTYLHLKHGGDWRPEFWNLVCRIVDYISKTWEQPGNGIWELSQPQHFVCGKIMSWAALDRALKIGELLGVNPHASQWRSVRDAIHAEVMRYGWSDRLGAFRQRYEADNLDASALLIPVMDMLPADHPKVLATVAQIARHLTIDGFVYRFVPRETAGIGDLPLGEYEGAFLPCTFWLATAYAKAGQIHDAEAVLKNAEALAGPLGLFAEGVDTRTRTFLGNTPLLFSHMEYVRAALELARARDRQAR